MGFHSFLQSQNVPFESVIAKVWNKRMFAHIRGQADAASRLLAEERGPCPDAEEYGMMERFSNKMAIAPTASISIIAGNASPGHRADRGQRVSAEDAFGQLDGAQPASAEAAGREGEGRGRGLVLDHAARRERAASRFSLTEQEKAVFKTAFELDQRWVIEHAADRTPYVCQSQSVNVFLPANVHKRDLHQIHMLAWKRGVKSLYYCRSLSIQRADTVSEKAVRPAEFTGVAVANDLAPTLPLVAAAAVNGARYEECLACQ